MPLVTTTKMLIQAQAEGYAVAAFNIENLEMVQAVLAAAEEKQAAVILQTTPATLRYAPPTVYAALTRSLAEDASVPVALHLDHGDRFEQVMQAIRAGYTSVMFDGSALPFKQNMAMTRQVVQAAQAAGLSTEAELGQLVGDKDDASIPKSSYTDPAQAAEFATRTGIDSLAPAIGTAHGPYRGAPQLDMPRLLSIKQQVGLPLVLHGASGLADEDILQCIQLGICKVNFTTDLHQSYTDAVRGVLCEDLDAYDPKIAGEVGRAAVQKTATQKIKLCQNKQTMHQRRERE